MSKGNSPIPTVEQLIREHSKARVLVRPSSRPFRGSTVLLSANKPAQNALDRLIVGDWPVEQMVSKYS